RRLLSPAARKFLLECGRTVRTALWRRRALPLVVLGVLGAFFFTWRVVRHREVDRNVAQRLAAAADALGEARAQEAALVAARSDSFREFDAGRNTKGEEAWQRALELKARSELAFAAAGEKFEGA